ncbi:MAG TPA: MATE family efflux transporter [Polyangiaceae bacterium]|nr:MATE family efflux transporter [Polyangiaceae bacterium]
MLERAPSHAPRVDQGLLTLSWPLLVSLALSLSLGFTDALFLSRVSDAAAGAVSAVLPAIGVFLVLFTSVAQAASNVSSQLHGAGRAESVPATRASAFYFNLLAGGLCIACLMVGSERIPAWLGLSSEMVASAAPYVRVIGGAYALKAIQLVYAGILNSRGQTRWVLAEAVVTNCSNILLNLACVRGHWPIPLGPRSVAWATLLAQSLGLGLTLFIVHGVLRIRIAWRAKLSELLARFRPVFGIGAISMLEPLGYQAAQICMTMILTEFGTKALAARAYVLNFFMVTTVLWCTGLSWGVQILVAHRIGERRFETASAVLMRAARLGFIGALGLGCLVTLGSEHLLRLMTSDPELIALAKPVMAVGIAVEAGRSVNIIVGGALRSSGDVRFTALVGALMMWVVGVSSALLLGRSLSWGLFGVWCAMALDECSRAVVNLLRWQTGRWKAGVALH